MNIESALHKLALAPRIIATYESTEERYNAQLIYSRTCPSEDKPTVHEWLRTNIIWLQAKRDEYELALRLAPLTPDQLESIAEDPKIWSNLFPMTEISSSLSGV